MKNKWVIYFMGIYGIIGKSVSEGSAGSFFENNRKIIILFYIWIDCNTVYEARNESQAEGKNITGSENVEVG